LQNYGVIKFVPFFGPPCVYIIIDIPSFAVRKETTAERLLRSLILGSSLMQALQCSVLGEDPLAFLRNQPQFMQMRQVIQQNPNLLPTILQQIRQSNPRLLQVSTSRQLPDLVLAYWLILLITLVDVNIQYLVAQNASVDTVVHVVY